MNALEDARHLIAKLSAAFHASGGGSPSEQTATTAPSQTQREFLSSFAKSYFSAEADFFRFR